MPSRYHARTGLDRCCFYAERGRSTPRPADSYTIKRGIVVHESGVIASRISPPVSRIYFQGKKGGVVVFQSIDNRRDNQVTKLWFCSPCRNAQDNVTGMSHTIPFGPHDNRTCPPQRSNCIHRRVLDNHVARWWYSSRSRQNG
jgi:hypothetical protein